jgi:hypothetical protein
MKWTNWASFPGMARDFSVIQNVGTGCRANLASCWVTRAKVARVWIWPLSAEVKNEWSYTSVVPICPRGMERENFAFPCSFTFTVSCNPATHCHNSNNVRFELCPRDVCLRPYLPSGIASHVYFIKWSQEGRSVVLVMWLHHPGQWFYLPPGRLYFFELWQRSAGTWNVCIVMTRYFSWHFSWSLSVLQIGTQHRK